MSTRLFYTSNLYHFFWREGSGRSSKYMTVKVLESSETSNICLTVWT